MTTFEITVEISTPIVFQMDAESNESVEEFIASLWNPQSEYYDRFWQYLYDFIQIKSITSSADS